MWSSFNADSRINFLTIRQQKFEMQKLWINRSVNLDGVNKYHQLSVFIILIYLFMQHYVKLTSLKMLKCTSKESKP